MSLNTLLMYVVPTAIILVLLLIVGFVFARLYKRALPEQALIRTGLGGRKVIKDGGALVFPALHQITPVNMKSVVITVRRIGEEALITQDSMRVDMQGDFTIRVGDDEDSISRAAQTLGDKTFDIAQLREQIEGKVVDAARSVAAGMTMDDLHAKRSDFVQSVQNQLEKDLKTNGLTLETVSLTSLDQTNYDNLNPNNAFNAKALTQLAEITSQAREKRSEREAAADIAVAENENRAAREKLRYEQELATEQANQAITVTEANAKKDQASARAAETVRRETEMAAQERQIAIAQKSREESEATAEANEAKAKAIESEEKVKTASEVAIAERAKRISVLRAEEEAESSATEIRVRAAAERAATADRVASMLETAEAEAKSITIRAEAEEKAGLAKARAREAMVEAENRIDPSVLNFNLNVKRAEMLPEVVREMMKPAEKIDGIRIFYGAPTGGAGGQGASSASNPTSLQDAILGVALNKPSMDAIGKMLAVDLSGGVSGLVGNNMDVETAPDVPEGIVSDEV